MWRKQQINLKKKIPCPITKKAISLQPHDGHNETVVVRVETLTGKTLNADNVFVCDVVIVSIIIVIRTIQRSSI